MRGNQSSPTKDCKYLNRNSSENRIYKIEFVHCHCSGWDKYKMFVYSLPAAGLLHNILLEYK